MKVFLEAFVFILVFLKTHSNSDPASAHPALGYSQHSIKHFCIRCVTKLDLHSNSEVFISKETGDQRDQMNCL